MCSSHEKGIPATEKKNLMIPTFTEVSHQQMRFLLQNKVPTENKVDYLLFHRTRYIGTVFEELSFNTT